MKRRLLIVFFWSISIMSLFAYVSCSKKHLNVPPAQTVFTRADSLKIKADSLLQKCTPVMGYRFVITGDFDGDSVNDTLVERYTDSLYIKEAPKYYVSNDTTFEYWDMTFLNQYFSRKSFIEWKDKKLKLPGGQMGFHYIENCGDINDDGKDELLLVNQWDDFSSTNTAYIYTYANGQWEEIYTTPIWEWQFPPTPSASMVPGLFGNFDYGTTEDEGDNKALEEQLKAYHFMTFYPDHSVEFTGRNAIGVWDNDAASNELEDIGEQEYINKYFKRTILNDSLYLNDIRKPAVYYKASEFLNEDVSIILLALDDPASGVTTRIFIKHPQSPFKKKPR